MPNSHANSRALAEPEVTLLDAALLAAGGGLMFIGGSHAMDKDGRTLVPGSLVTVAGAGLMVYAAWRIRPTIGASLGAVILGIMYINEHRRSLGLPDLVPNIRLPWGQEVEPHVGGTSW
jgi:hypothetical protein